MDTFQRKEIFAPQRIHILCNSQTLMIGEILEIFYRHQFD